MKRQIFFLTFTLVALFFHSKVNASHCAGGDLTYTHVTGTPDSQYHFIFKLYRDCKGTSNEPSNVDLCYINSCNANGYTVNMQKTAGLPGGVPNGTEVLVGCSGYPTTCQSPSSSLPGYEEWWYEADVTLPFKCSNWEFSVSISARNSNDNLNGSSNLFFIKTTLNNLVAQGNSSPSFTIKPVPYACTNVPYFFNNGVIDANGDSLSYEMLVPLAGNCGDIGAGLPYKVTTPPFNNTTNPLACNNTFALDPINGQSSFTPSQSGNYTITLRVNEYRNHIKIGSVIRDIQVVVLNTCSNLGQPTIGLDTANIVGGQIVNGVIRNCSNTPMHFCFAVTSPSPGAVLVPTDNHASIIPAATMTYTGQYTGTIHGCFTWTPSANDTGFKNFIITIKDSTCLPPGILYVYNFPVSIYVSPVTNIFKDTAICQGSSVQLLATGGTAFTWSVLPGGAPLSTLSCTGCPSPVANPTVTTNYVVLSNISTNACNKNKDTVTVTVLPIPPPPSPTSNSPLCKGDTLKLYANSFATSFTWIGPAGFNSTQQNPKIFNAQVPNSGTYQVIARNGNCVSQPATINVVVTGNIPTPVITGNSPVCEGGTIQLSASGTGYNYIWTGPSGFSATTQTASIPNVTTANAGVYSVKAYLSQQCASQLVNYTVVVNPPVVADFTVPDSLCQADTLHVTYTGSLPAPTAVAWSFANGNVISGTGIGPYLVHFPTVGMKAIRLVTANPGCSDTMEKVVIVLESPTAEFDLPTDACIADTVNVLGAFDGGNTLTYTWNFGAAIVASGKGGGPYRLVFNQPGYQNVTLVANNILCKSKKIIQTVYVHPHPDVHIISVSSSEICTRDSVRFTINDNPYYRYKWTPEIDFAYPHGTFGTTDGRMAYSGFVYVQAIDSSGCKATDSVHINTQPCCDAYLPSAFTPNGDGKNDLFKVITKGNHEIENFRIINRWGQTVFETFQENRGWDGKVGGVPAEIGTYFYILKYKCSNDQSFMLKGDFVLVR